MRGYVVLSGAGGGLGRALLDALLKNDYAVFALDINIGELSPAAGLHPLRCDITKAEDVAAALASVKTITERLHAVVNAAGIFGMDTMLDASPERMRAIMDVNLMGMFRLNQIFFPLVQRGAGRIVNISSECGWEKATPFNGLYTISKKAVEAYSDTLRRECAFIKVPVIKIQPGSFQSPLHEKVRADFERLRRCSDYFKPVLATLEAILWHEMEKAHDPKIFAATVLRALKVRRPRIRYRVKTSPLLALMSLLPDYWLDKAYLLWHRIKNGRPLSH